MTLAKLLRAYAETNPNVSEKTVKLFEIVIRHFEAFLGREGTLDDLTNRNLVAFMRKRQKLGRAIATVDNELVKLLCLWRYASAVERQWCKAPAMKIHRQKPGAPRAFLSHEIRALFRAARKSKKMIGQRGQIQLPVWLYFGVMFGLHWETGERFNGIVEVNRNDIDLRHRCVTYRIRKQRGAPVVKPISRWTARRCRQLLAASPGDKPLRIVCASTTYYHFEQLMIAAGIPPERRKRWHAWRKSHVSYVKKNGGDGAQAAGHSNEETTRTWYYDPRIVGHLNPLRLLFNPTGLVGSLLALLGL